MKKMHQFWTLLKFQIHANPGVVIAYPLLFSIVFLIFFHSTPITLAHYLGWLLSGNYLFFVPLVATSTLAPELSLVGSAISAQNSGTEFLLTQSVDRSLLLRVRSVLFFGLILVIPTLLFLGALRSPQLQLKESDHRIYHQILNQIQSSITDLGNTESNSTQRKAIHIPEMITIPNGQIFIGSWRIWVFLCTGIATQLFLFLICSLRYQKFLFYGAILALMFGPLLILIYARIPSFEFYFHHSNEVLFIYFAGHQLLCWLFATAVLILGQLWSENRFSRMEH